MDEDLAGALTERDRGRVFIYDTVTAERSEILATLLPQELRKKRKDGSPVFTTTKPSWDPIRGTIKCYLHTDNPDRDYYTSLGFPTCRKSNITSPLQLILHMKHRHKMEWETIGQNKKDDEEARRQAERADDRKFQRELLSKK